MPYLWQDEAWPGFTWDAAALTRNVADVAVRRGQLVAQIGALGLTTRADLEAASFVEDAVHTSLIEAVSLPPASVRSSVARRLGLPTAGLAAPQRDADGLVEILFDATRQCGAALTDERLWSWHRALFPTGWSGMTRVAVGKWRTTPIQVRSGAIGAERVHFEGPPAERVSSEMAQLVDWWNHGSTGVEGTLRAALAHLWFETIHPFEDGNGRIGRALADMALAQADGVGRRFYSLSRQLRDERKAYYATLQRAQTGTLDVTEWLAWFLACAERAMAVASAQVHIVLARARVLQRGAADGLSPRQLKVLARLLEAGPEGFEGGLDNRKYRALTRVSRATATRDLVDLERRRYLVRGDAAGRSTRYQLDPAVWDPNSVD